MSNCWTLLINWVTGDGGLIIRVKKTREKSQMSRDLFKTSPEETGPTEKQLLEKEKKDLQVHRDKERVPVSDSIKEKFALFKVFIFWKRGTFKVEMMEFTASQEDPLLDRKTRENPFASKKSAGIRAFFGCGGN
jgi:hypothetical protein